MTPRLNTPSFWYDTESPTARAKASALAAFSGLYAIGHGLHRLLSPAPQAVAGVRVVCIGNLVAGGGGKTPAAIAVMEIIQSHKIAGNPCFLTRGYGGAAKGPLLVDPATHTARDVGDEALLLAAHAPVIVAHNRLAGARHAAALGHDWIVMDDGLQNPTLRKDLSILVIDGPRGFGNGLLLPAGPLRMPVGTGLALADMVLMIGKDRRDMIPTLPAGKPVLRAHTEPRVPDNPRPRYLAFCGIAQPEKFSESLRTAGLNIADFEAFPDHYPFSAADIQDLRRRAAALDARLITTTKDAARLRGCGFIDAGEFDILHLTFRWDDGSDAVIRNALTDRNGTKDL